MAISLRRSFGALAVASTAFTGLASTAIVSAPSADARAMHSWSNVPSPSVTMRDCQRTESARLNYLRRKHVHINSYGHCRNYGTRWDPQYDYDYIYYNAPVRMLSRDDARGFWRWSTL